MKTAKTKLLDAITNLNIIVIGEAMLDTYLEGFSDRVCPEAPVPLVNVTNRLYAPSGAANTAVNVRRLSGHVTFISVATHVGWGASAAGGFPSAGDWRLRNETFGRYKCK